MNLTLPANQQISICRHFYWQTSGFRNSSEKPKQRVVSSLHGSSWYLRWCFLVWLLLADLPISLSCCTKLCFSYPFSESAAKLVGEPWQAERNGRSWDHSQILRKKNEWSSSNTDIILFSEISAVLEGWGGGSSTVTLQWYFVPFVNKMCSSEINLSIYFCINLRSRLADMSWQDESEV